MELAKLVLEYIKVLMWPLVLSAALYLYSDEVMNIIKTREFEAFGVKIGGTLETIAENYESEIIALKEQISQLESGDDSQTANLIYRLDNISSNVQQDLTALRTQVVDPADQVTQNKQAAIKAETAGFEAIKNRDVKTAIEQFAIAKDKWPKYHNVEEILALLQRNQNNLTTAQSWQRLYQTLLQNYSWGMPQAVRSDLLQVTPAARSSTS